MNPTNLEFEKALENEQNQRVMSEASRGYRILGKDVVQSCKYIGLWESLRDYNGEQDNQFTSYLYSKVRWQCLQELRNLRKEYIYGNRNLQFSNLHKKTLDKVLSYTYDTLSDVVLELTKSELKLFNSRFINMKKLREISEEEHTSIQNIQKRLDKIRKKIERILTQ